jgi:hypothetical protein
MKDGPYLAANLGRALSALGKHAISPAELRRVSLDGSIVSGVKRPRHPVLACIGGEMTPSGAPAVLSATSPALAQRPT